MPLDYGVNCFSCGETGLRLFWTNKGTFFLLMEQCVDDFMFRSKDFTHKLFDNNVFSIKTPMKIGWKDSVLHVEKFSYLCKSGGMNFFHRNMFEILSEWLRKVFAELLSNKATLRRGCGFCRSGKVKSDLL